MSLHDWLKSFGILQLPRWLNQEPSMRDDLDILKKMYADSKNTEHRLFQYSLETLGHQRGAPDHLNLTTYHSSKGLEYDVVIMPGLEQGRMPHPRNSLKEERRKFYVAMTRARHEVHFLWSGWYEHYSRTYHSGRSQFIDEVMKKLGESR
jgi:DNA helicase-2/ATP-dependent DNA helicase PcrA